MIVRLLRFEVDGLVSVGRWLLRRPDVPAGAVAVPYAKAQNPLLTVFLVVQVVETVGVELLLRGLGVPEAVRVPLLALGVYGSVMVAGMIASGVVRPHVVTGAELRVRLGHYLDVRVPVELVESTGTVRGYESSLKVDGERLIVPVGSQTNTRVTLREPITVTRPLGRTAEVRVIDFYAESPPAAVGRPSSAPGR
ncbi:hypothetical protein [Herbidospora sp. NBRC 101105]|uniref:hypothetical protein n=1 Tax=Herbidospora sp. NBRC 101105 TaxID=3032195 RepID=UPI0024A452E9|nr:hypothetical protein [Herbidospora sp. NBRC 101105]GLX97733.1 hypothetical protein Hesp01_56830 [Herbidospora sp. NBRC 101105]